MNEAGTFAVEALRQDQRRVRRIAGLTIGLWVLTALVIPGFYAPFAAFVEPKLRLLEKHAAEKDPAITAHLIAGHIAVTQRAATIALIGAFSAFTLASLLAAVCTIWLVFTVRGLTLRRLQEGLAEISRELQRIKG